MQPLEKNNKKVTKAWAVYDWANSVYSLVITSTVFPIYYNAITKSERGNLINVFGFEIENSVAYSYTISLAFLLIAFISPILSGIADVGGYKKRFMQFFVLLGSISCISMYFFTSENIAFGLITFGLAAIAFSGSLVFYNSYLPEIATPDHFDKLSAKGYAYGYVGSVILLGINLAMILNPSLIGLKPNTILGNTLPARISFITVGIWWFGFSLYSFYYLPSSRNKILKVNVLSYGFKKLNDSFKKLKNMEGTQRFLTSYFFYNLSVQTVMLLATTFGTKVLGLETSILIISVLLIQIVAIFGAYIFANFSKKRGNIASLQSMILIWIGICVSAYFVSDATQFVALATVVGLVMGGIQSLSRSTFSKLIPENEEHSTYFSLMDFLEKIGIVLGTAIFGIVESVTGNMRNSLMVLIASFLIGFYLLIKIKGLKVLNSKQ